MKVIKVIQIKTFDNKQYLVRRDKPWAEELHQLLTTLINDRQKGSVALLSLGTVDEKVFLSIPNVGTEINSLQIKKGNSDGEDN